MHARDRDTFLRRQGGQQQPDEGAVTACGNEERSL